MLLLIQKLTYVTDDVINYLGERPEKRTYRCRIWCGDIIRAYRGTRVFLAKLSSILVPYHIAYFADHLTLHSLP